MEPFELKSKEYFLIDAWNKENRHIIAGITSKNGGFSTNHYSSLNMGFHVGDIQNSVCDNRNKLADLLEFPMENWIGAEQTHEVHIKRVNRTDCGNGSKEYETAFKGTDGFFTIEKGILLTLCYADCVPLYFYAPKKDAIGLAHAGWRGTVNGIGGKMVDVFQQENIKPDEIHVVIGPSICEKCYIVDDRVIKFVQNILEDVDKKPYNLIKDNQYSLNLQELNKLILINNGVLEENIHITDLCTSCQSEQFFSHRRDKGQTGRMMSFIGFKEDLKR